MSTQALPAFDRDDPLGLDASLSSDELAVRDTVRKLCAEHVIPYVADWFEIGDLPVRELAKQFGQLGLLGMHLHGYGCGGASAVHYGLACVELEAADSGVRSMVSVQGSLAMFAIWNFGSEEQKQQWLPGMAAGELLGCFGLTEPDVGSDPAAMKTRARRDGSDWVINGRKMWITNGSVADVAIAWAATDDGIRGFIVPTDTAGFTANTIHHKLSLRASITSELVLDDVRLPADAMLPEAKGLKGPLSCLSEARYGIIWGSMGAARSAWQAALDYATQRTQFGRPIAAFQLTQAKLVDMAVELHKGQLLALHLGRLKDSVGLRPEQVSFGKLNNTREAIEICRNARTILGGNGISLEYPVIRHMVNLESVLTYEGTPEMPLIYCVEEADNPGGPVQTLSLPRSTRLDTEMRTDLFGGVMTLKARAKRLIPGGQAGALYSTAPPATEEAALVALPYHLWANRAPGSMQVWVAETEG